MIIQPLIEVKNKENEKFYSKNVYLYLQKLQGTKCLPFRIYDAINLVYKVGQDFLDIQYDN